MGPDGLIGPSVLILGFFACSLLVRPQELYSLKVTVERRLRWMVGGRWEDQKPEGGAVFLASLPPSRCNH